MIKSIANSATRQLVQSGKSKFSGLDKLSIRRNGVW